VDDISARRLCGKTVAERPNHQIKDRKPGQPDPRDFLDAVDTRKKIDADQAVSISPHFCLLWESACAGLYFTSRLWPDFGRDDLAAAVGEFRRRERRFGALPEAAAS
jgi:Putative undecaprenyl diphosphate synthase